MRYALLISALSMVLACHPASAQSPAAQSPAALVSPTLEAAKARGHVLCGVNEGLTGFAARDATGEWQGFEADICRAVAAATLGKGEAVRYVPLDTNNRFSALQAGKVDILARNTTWTMERQVKFGFEFVGISFFDGQGFMIRADRGVVSALQLAGTRICVVAGTTSEANLNIYLQQQGVPFTALPLATHQLNIEAYRTGKCDVYSADYSTLFSLRTTLDQPTDHAILPELISKEPIGLAVREDDRAWGEIVRWTLNGLINAEEFGLTRAIAINGAVSGDAARLMEGSDVSGVRLGLKRGWLGAAVAAVGNYAELFDRTIGDAGPLGMKRGLNALWRNGGILYAPPMW